MAEWISYAEAARRLGVSDNTVGAHLAAGRLVRREGLPRGFPCIDAVSVERLASELEAERVVRVAVRRDRGSATAGVAYAA